MAGFDPMRVLDCAEPTCYRTPMHGLPEILLVLAFGTTALAAFTLWRCHFPKRVLLILLLAFWPAFVSLALLGKDFGQARQAMLPVALAVTVAAAALGVLVASALRRSP